jgi:hypothetical protein
LAVFSIIVTILAVPEEQSVLVPDVVSTIIAQPQSTDRYGVPVLMPFRVTGRHRRMAVLPFTVPAACP